MPQKKAKLALGHRPDAGAKRMMLGVVVLGESRTTRSDGAVRSFFRPRGTQQALTAEGRGARAVQEEARAARVPGPSNDPRRKYLVTPALPYANGPLHLGHAVEYVLCDVFVRYLRSDRARGGVRLRGTTSTARRSS
jgi:hypothetical protein